MRPRYSFSSRRTGHLKNIRKQRKKFPSITEKILEEADIIVEVLDARFIHETKNPEIEQAIKSKNKKIIYVLNKSDLINEENIKEFSEKSVLVSCKDRTGISELRNIIKIIASQIKKINKASGFKFKGPKAKSNIDQVVIGVLGYPNTGKSSLINVLIGRNSAATSSQSGYTKSIQKLKLMEGIVLLDSPGVIPKKEYSSIESVKIAKHAKIGSRTYSNVKNPEQVITEIMREYPELFEKYYKIKAKGNSETLLEELGGKKNFLKKKGVIDTDKTSRFVLKEWQEGKIRID